MAELAASWIAKDMTKRGDYLSRRIPYMAVLAPLANAPFLRLSDYILFRMNFYQRRIVTRILWIVANNFIVSPTRPVMNCIVFDFDLVSLPRFRLSSLLSFMQ